MAVGFVLITTEPGREIEVRDKVSKLANVSGQWIVFGMHDLFVKVEADDDNDLTRCIMNQVRAIDGIAETRTIIGAEI